VEEPAARNAPPATPEATTPRTAGDAPAASLCGNCGAELLGNHCYRCGQPVRGLVRHFSSVVGDFFDSVFNLDSRTLQTLAPLFFRPGFLTREYFAGRRVRYVTPVRMFVFLTIIAFFVSNLALDIEDGSGTGDGVVIDLGDKDAADAPSSSARDVAIERADSVASATTTRDRVLAELAQARKETAGVPGVGAGLASAEADVRATAKRRIQWLRERDVALAAGKTPPPEPRRRRGIVHFGNWDPSQKPLALPWLPDFANAALTRWGRRAYDNGDRIRDNPRLLVEAFFTVAPQTLFVLLPMFALLLKIVYVFKRRLYMEHMIVALHSHAFIALWLILIIADYALGGAVTWPWLKALLNVVVVLLWIWLPLYLFLMQKRVYAQGWIMTLLKFLILGIAYLVLLSFGATIALLLSLVTL